MLLEFKGKRKSVSHDTLAGVLMILGGIVLLPVLVVSAFYTTFALERTGLVLSILLSVAFCIVWVMAGIRVVVRTSKFRQISKILIKSPRFGIPALVNATRTPLEQLSIQLNAMLARGYFGDASVDLDKKELIFNKASEPIASRQEDRKTIYEMHRKVPGLQIVVAAVTAFAIFMAQERNNFTAIVCAAIGVGAFFAVMYFIPWTAYYTEVERPLPIAEPFKKTGNSEYDEIVSKVNEQNAELLRLNYAISNPSINKPLEESIKVLSDMLGVVKEKPEKIKQLREFLNYYLPTTVKLLSNYEELSNKEIKGENITQAMSKIEGMLPQIAHVFKREYDELFMERAMDISAEVDVMKAMIRQSEDTDNPF